MAGVSLQSLKRRLKTVESTRKITMAMGLVSTSKYQRARLRLSANQQHYNSFQEIVNEIVAAGLVEETEDPGLYLRSPGLGRPNLYLIFNSVKGLAAGYNSAVGDAAWERIQIETSQPIVLTTGTRGIAALRSSLPEQNLELIEMGDLPDFDEADRVVERALELYRTGQVHEVFVVYTRYLSALHDEVRVERVLPFEVPEKHENKGIKYEFEPDASRMQDQIFTMFLREKLYHMLLHAKTAEHSTRMKAMDSANKNADEIIFDLSRQFNRVRQTAITQEITEIVGGAEAQK